MSKLKINLDDSETRALWETALRAKAEVESWPAWKRSEMSKPEPSRALELLGYDGQLCFPSSERYLAFAGEQYYPGGGIADYIGAYPTAKLASEAANFTGSGWKQVVDRLTMREVQWPYDTYAETEAALQSPR